MKPRHAPKRRNRGAPFTLDAYRAARAGKAAPPAKRHKYGAAVVRDGLGVKTFDSSKEGKRAFQLSVLERTGEISELSTQPKFPIIINGMVVCEYWGDFMYRDRAGRWVIEDTKSVQTRKLRAYRIKAKLMKALYGVEITES